MKMNSKNKTSSVINWKLIDSDQAMSILKTLASENKTVAARIQDIITQLNVELNPENISSDLLFELEFIDVEDLWQSSGSTQYGYIDPIDRAYEMIEEAVEPFKNKFDTYLKSSMLEEAKIFCMGMVSGLYEFEYQSQGEFQEWATDVAGEIATDILDTWKKHCNDNNKLKEVDHYLAEHCLDLTSKTGQ